MFPQQLYSAPSGGGPVYATNEWFVVRDPSSNLLRYYSVNHSTNTESALGTVSSSGSTGICTDGTFIWATVGGAGLIAQYAWNGSALTLRYTGSDGGGNVTQTVRHLYGNGNHLVSAGSGSFGAGAKCFTYQTAPTYSYGTASYYNSGNDFAAAWTVIMDFRFAGGIAGNLGYGDTIVLAPSATSDYLRSATYSGTTITTYGSGLTTNTANGGYWGWDRDTGYFVGGPQNSTTVRVYRVDPSTRLLSDIGTGATTGNHFDLCMCKGFVLALEEAGATDYLRSYSRSGATLTQVSQIALPTGVVNTNGLCVSPFSEKVYVGLNADMRVCNVSDTGVLTFPNIITGAHFSMGQAKDMVAFMASALPTV